MASVASQEMERMAHATRDFLVATRRESLGALRASALEGALMGGVDAEKRRDTDTELLRAEYEDMRAMHILFVQASNRKLAELQDVTELKQVPPSARPPQPQYACASRVSEGSIESGHVADKPPE
jgi:hypothetical protein